MVFRQILVLRIDVLATDLPDKRMEFVLQAVFAHPVQGEDFIGAGHEIRPDIVMHRNDDLGAQRFRHAQQINGRHLVGNPDRVLAVIVERDIDVKILAVFREIDGVMRIRAVVNRAARRLEYVIHRLAPH